MSKIDVLDHGYVRLVSYMQPVPAAVVHNPEGKYVGRYDDWTGDLEIVRNARTSYNADWRAKPQAMLPPSENWSEPESKDAKLIHYLKRLKEYRDRREKKEKTPALAEV